MSATAVFQGAGALPACHLSPSPQPRRALSPGWPICLKSNLPKASQHAVGSRKHHRVGIPDLAPEAEGTKVLAHIAEAESGWHGQTGSRLPGAESPPLSGQPFPRASRDSVARRLAKKPREAALTPQWPRSGPPSWRTSIPVEPLPRPTKGT